MLLQAQERSLALYQAQGNEIAAIKSAVGKLSDRVEEVAEFSDRMTSIHSGQARILRRMASKRVRELLSDDGQYKELKSRYYSWLWRRYQDAFGVTSYLDTRLKYFEAAQQFIREWQLIEMVRSAG